MRCRRVLCALDIKSVFKCVLIGLKSIYFLRIISYIRIMKTEKLTQEQVDELLSKVNRIKAEDCDCDEGVHWNNADPTSGQYIVCYRCEAGLNPKIPSYDEDRYER